MNRKNYFYAIESTLGLSFTFQWCQMTRNYFPIPFCFDRAGLRVPRERNVRSQIDFNNCYFRRVCSLEQKSFRSSPSTHDLLDGKSINENIHRISPTNSIAEPSTCGENLYSAIKLAAMMVDTSKIARIAAHNGLPPVADVVELDIRLSKQGFPIPPRIQVWKVIQEYQEYWVAEPPEVKRRDLIILLRTSVPPLRAKSLLRQLSSGIVEKCEGISLAVLSRKKSVRTKHLYEQDDEVEISVSLSDLKESYLHDQDSENSIVHDRSHSPDTTENKNLSPEKESLEAFSTDEDSVKNEAKLGAGTSAPQTIDELDMDFEAGEEKIIDLEEVDELAADEALVEAEGPILSSVEEAEEHDILAEVQETELIPPEVPEIMEEMVSAVIAQAVQHPTKPSQPPGPFVPHASCPYLSTFRIKYCPLNASSTHTISASHLIDTSPFLPFFSYTFASTSTKRRMSRLRPKLVEKIPSTINEKEAMANSKKNLKVRKNPRVIHRCTPPLPSTSSSNPSESVSEK